MNIKNNLLSLGYVVFAGVVPALLLYFLCFKLLGVIEGLDLKFFVSTITIVSMLSPIIGPLFGAFLFYKFIRLSNPGFVFPNLWKYTLIYSLIVIGIFELYFVMVEPIWSGFGLILGGLVGITLSIFSYFKERRIKIAQN